MATVTPGVSIGVIDSVILEAAEAEATRLGIDISAPAKNWLITKVRPRLDELFTSGELEGRREEIVANTATLIKYVFVHQLHSQKDATITLDLISDAFKRLCEFFENLIPFCP